MIAVLLHVKYSWPYSTELNCRASSPEHNVLCPSRRSIHLFLRKGCMDLGCDCCRGRSPRYPRYLSQEETALAVISLHSHFLPVLYFSCCCHLPLRYFIALVLHRRIGTCIPRTILCDERAKFDLCFVPTTGHFLAANTSRHTASMVQAPLIAGKSFLIQTVETCLGGCTNS